MTEQEKFAVHLVDPCSRSQVAELVAIWNACWPDWALTIDEMIRIATADSAPHWLLLAEQQGQAVAMAHARQSGVQPPRFELQLCVCDDYRRQGIGGRLYERTVAQIAPLLPAPINVMTREDWHDAVAVLDHYGYKLRMRQLLSQLDVAEFDGQPFQPLLQQIAATGFRIVTVEQLIAEQGDAAVWRQLYELHNTVYVDVPTVEDEWQPPAADAWIERRRSSPRVLLDGWFVAVNDEGRMVAVSRVSKHATGDEMLEHGLTGTLRAYRRRGLATALKVHVHCYAQRKGYRIIRTDNAEGNPMYALNLALGYKPLPALLLFEKWVDV